MSVPQSIILIVSFIMSQLSSANELDFTQEIRISASPEAVWKAITQPEMVKKYHLAPLHKLELKKNGEIIYGSNEENLISGVVKDFEENVRLIHTFRFGSQNHLGTEEDQDTMVSYFIQSDGPFTILKVTHSGFSEDNQTRADIVGGWPIILQQLKAILEAEARQ